MLKLTADQCHKWIDEAPDHINYYRDKYYDSDRGYSFTPRIVFDIEKVVKYLEAHLKVANEVDANHIYIDESIVDVMYDVLKGV